MPSNKQGPSRTESLQALAVSSCGNMLQWYAFAVYSYFALVVGKLFFPKELSEVEALMSAFLIYGVGFLGRPLGGLIFGPLGDRYGRKFLLILTISLMGGGTILIGVAPTYETIGIWAPILLIIARLMQGLSVGGEWAIAAIFMIEWAPTGLRGLWGSFQQASITLGFFVASLIAAICVTFVGAEGLETWGWRIPFLVGGVALWPFAVFMEGRIKETPVYKAAVSQAAVTPPKPLPWPIAASFCTVAIGGVWIAAYYIFMTYTTTWATTFMGVPFASSLWVNTFALLCFTFAIPVCGWLSDIFGRKALLLTGSLAMLFVPYLVYGYMQQFQGSIIALLLFQLILVVCLATFSGPGPTTLSEMFPTRQRSTWLSPTYSLSTAIAAGFAPMISIWMIDVFNNPAVHSFYLTGLGVLAVVAVLSMRETAFDEELQ